MTLLFLGLIFSHPRMTVHAGYLHGHKIRISPGWFTEDHRCSVLYWGIVREAYLRKQEKKFEYLEYIPELEDLLSLSEL